MGKRFEFGGSEYDDAHDWLTGAHRKPHRGEGPSGFAACQVYPLSSKGESSLSSNVSVIVLFGGRTNLIPVYAPIRMD
jgi:hypothetical protein